MRFSWIRSLFQRPSPTSRRPGPAKRPGGVRPTLEVLECRTVPTFIQSALAAPPNIAAVADFNGDGRLDVVTVLNTSPGFASSISVLLGNGDNTFQAPTSYGVGTLAPTQVLVADVNGDGKLDLVVPGSNIFTLLGNGDGTFQAPVQSTTNISSQLVLGDFNGDGKQDLAGISFQTDSFTHELTSASLQIYHGNGDGTFNFPTQTPLSSRVHSIAAGDINSDGKLDLAIASQSWSPNLPVANTPTILTSSVSVLQGNGDGTFQAPMVYAADSVAMNLPVGGVQHFTDAGDVTMGDFNGDGRTDIAVVNNLDTPKYQVVLGNALLGQPGGTEFVGFTSQVGSVSMFLGNGDGSFQAPRNSMTGSSPGKLVVTDFNGDGRPDLGIGANAGVNVLLANGDGTFQLPETFAGVMPSDKAALTHLAMVVGDFNGDGHPDIATSDGHILTGNGDGSFQGVSVAEAGLYPGGQAVGDFNGDGIPDVAIASDSDATVTIFLVSHGALAPFNTIHLSSPFGFYADAMAVGDFNGDGKLDLAVANRNGSGPLNPGGLGMAAVLLGNGDGTFSAPTFYGGPGTYAYDVTVAGNELLLQHGNGTLSVLVSNGDGTFHSAPDIVLGSSPPPGTTAALSSITSVAAGDFNGDGKADFVVTTLGGNLQPNPELLPDPRLGFDKHVKVVLNDGTPQGTVTVLDAGLDPSNVTTGDFNGDGKLDIAVHTHVSALDQGSIDVFLGNGDGTFQSPINSGPDLESTSGGVNASLNLVLGSFSQFVSARNAAPVLADLNGDGNVDLVMSDPWGVGVRFGHGDGTFYAETLATSGPISAVANVSAADFNGDGHPDIAQSAIGFGVPSTVTLVMNAHDDRQVFDSVRASAVGFKISAPPTAAEGQPFSVTVSAVDAAGNPVPGFLGTVFLRSTDPTWTGPILQGFQLTQAPYEYTFTAADAGTHVFTFGVTLSTDGSQTITAGAPFMTDGSTTVAVSPAHMVVTQGSTTAVAGVPLAPITLTVLDAAGNVVTGYTGTVTITSSDPKAKPVTYNFLQADGGTHTFASEGTLFTAGNQTLTISGTQGLTANQGVFNASVAISGAMMTPLTSTVTVTPGAAGVFVLNTPATAVAGVPFNFTVTIYDRFGNFAPGGTPTVSFGYFLTPAGGGFIGGALPNAPYTFTAADAGVHVFTATLTVAGSNFIGAGTPTATGGVSPAIQVVGGAATRFQIGDNARLVTAGNTVGFTVTAFDAYGNFATGYSSRLHFTSSDPQVVMPDAPALWDGTYFVTFKTAGLQTVGVADVSNLFLNASTPAFTVLPAAPTSLLLTGSPASTAGVAQTLKVEVKDPYGNDTPGYFGTVHFTSSDPRAVLPADVPFGGSSAQFISATFKTAGTQSITVEDPFFPPFTSTVSGIAVSPGAAASFIMSGFPATTAGVTQTGTLTAMDAFGNLATGYTGTVNFSSSDAQAGLPANYTFTAADAGVHSFSATLKTAGSQSITIQDAANAAVAGTETGIVVSPSSAVSYSVTAPSTATAGVAQSITVTARDAFGNVAAGYAGTVTLSSSDVQAGLPAAYTFTTTPTSTTLKGITTVTPADLGVHTFTVTLKTAGTQSIVATDTANAGITGGRSIGVVPSATPGSFVVTGFPATTAGVAQTFTVTVKDAFGNVSSGYTGTVVFSSTDGQAGLPANYTFTAADAGVHAFTATLKTAGVQTITVKDSVTTTAVGTQTGITVAAAAAASFSVTGSTAATAGAAYAFTVTARDAFGNVATGYAGTVTFRSSDVQAGLPAGYTFTAADAGVHTFSATLKTAGSQSITVTDTASAALVGSQSGIAVSAAAATQFLFIAPTTVTQGVGFTFTVKVLDAYGNVVTGYRGKVHLSSTDAKAGTQDYTFSSSDNGVHVFSYTFSTLGLQTLTITDTSNSAITGRAVVNVVAKTSGGGH